MLRFIKVILCLLPIVNNWILINSSRVMCLEVTILVKVDKDDLTAIRNADILQIWHSIALPSVRFFLRPFMRVYVYLQIVKRTVCVF